MSLVHTASNTGVNRGVNRMVFRNPRGNKYYYCIYKTDITYNIKLEYSTDGTTWTNTVQAVYSAGSTMQYDVKIYDSGSDLKIFLVFFDYDNGDLIYMRGSLSDAGSTPTWDTAQQIDAAVEVQITTLAHQCAIARTDNGRLVVVFTEDAQIKGKDYRYTKIIGSDGDGAAPTWSNETTLDDPSPNANNEDKVGIWVGMESFSSSYGDRVLIYARIPDGGTSTAYDVKLWVYDWNGSAMSEQTTDTLSTTDDPDWGSRLSAVIDDDDKVHIIYEDNINDLQHNKYPTAGGLGSESTTELSADDIDACTVTIDRTNDEVYAFYHHFADSINYHYKKSATGTISFGSEQTITFSGDINAIACWNSDIENDLHIMFSVADVYYDTLSITVAEPTNVLEGKLIYRKVNPYVNERIN